MAIEVTKSKPQAPKKFLILGEPFSGKTTLAARAPNPIFISTDGNAGKMGLAAINVKSKQDISEAINYVIKQSEYKTIVIDTLEGIVDILTNDIIEGFNRMGFKVEGKPVQSLNDLPWGKGTSMLNNRVQTLSTLLADLSQYVIVLSYTKRRIDEVTNSIMLDSEFKNIRLLTRFMDAQVLTSFDGKTYKANITNKREAIGGAFDPGEIGEFMAAIGWDLPKKSTKLGDVK